MTSGLALRDQGVTDTLAADVAVHRGYAELVREAVDAIGGHLTSDDVRAWIETTYPDARPHSPNVIGGAIMRLAESGRIEPAGYRPSTRPGARNRIVRVWAT